MLNMSDSYSAARRTVAVSKLPGTLVRLVGAQHRQLLSWMLARATEYARPDTSTWSLLLDEDGTPAGTALVLIGEVEDLLLVDVHAGWLEKAYSTAPELVREASSFVHIDHGAAISVEGPRSWEVVAPLIDQPISDVLLNEVVSGELNGLPVHVSRTGTTSEFGYVVVGASDTSNAFDSLVDEAQKRGGGAIDRRALVRVHVETNHPLVPAQTNGLSVVESGVSWLVSLTREDSFHGDKVLNTVPATRRLVAAYSRGEDFPEEGAAVLDGDQEIGAVHVSAPMAGCHDGIGLVLLERPYCVSGLVLKAGGKQIETVSRPTLVPLSWSQTIGVSL